MDCRGECLRQSCEHCLDEHSAWGHASTVVQTYKVIISKIEELAASQFINHKDESAKIYRGLALNLREELKEHDKTLDAFINASFAKARRG